MDRLALDLLGDARPLPLTRESIDALAGKFGHRWIQTWADVTTLAESFWREQVTGDDVAKQMTWHHLLLGVGNFKRSAGTMLPLRSTLQPNLDVVPADSLKVPGVNISLDRMDRTTWRALTDGEKKVVGLSVPTASTLLAALWPGDHAILDVRVTVALVDLTAGVDKGIPPTLEATGSAPERDWDLYDLYLSFLSKTASAHSDSDDPCSRLVVERALFYLDYLVERALAKQMKAQKRSPGKWRWSEYRVETENQLKALST